MVAVGRTTLIYFRQCPQQATVSEESLIDVLFFKERGMSLQPNDITDIDWIPCTHNNVAQLMTFMFYRQ